MTNAQDKKNLSMTATKKISENSEPSNREIPELFDEQAMVIHDYSNFRKMKTPRVFQDFSKTVSKTDQHTASTYDLNLLVERYTPDEITNYLIAKGRSRQPIEGHDFSIEPSYQDALNEVQRIKKIFNELPHEVQSQFKNPLDFVRFVDNPNNVQRLVDLNLLKKKDLQKPAQNDDQTTKPAPKTDPSTSSSAT